MRLIVLTLLVLVFLFGCEPRVPTPYVQSDELVDLGIIGDNTSLWRRKSENIS